MQTRETQEFESEAESEAESKAARTTEARRLV
jgi:hypothetical protein